VKVVMPDSATRKAINWNRAILAATAIMTVFLAMLAAYAIVRYVIVKPLEHRRDVADEVRRGNVQARAEIHTADEFEELGIAFNRMLADGRLKDFPLRKLVAAVSAGVYQGTPVLDLNYPEDKAATVDFNIVMTEALEFVEVQGSGEEAVFTTEQMTAMLDLSRKGISEIFSLQKIAILNADKAEPVDFASLVSSFGKKSL
jgi:ribonuclease PH